MKRVLSVLLALVFVVAGFSGCNKKTEKKDENYNTKQVNNTNVASYVEKGVLDFSKVAVGMKVNDAIEQFHKEADMKDGTRVVLGETVYGNYKGLQAREVNNEVYDISKYTNTSFVYDLNNEQNGIVAICTVYDVYGFQNGITLTEDVTNSLGETEKYTPSSDELFFLPVKFGAEALKYSFGENTVTFYFVDNFLSATVLSSTANYDPSQTK